MVNFWCIPAMLEKQLIANEGNFCFNCKEYKRSLYFERGNEKWLIHNKHLLKNAHQT
jgi:hypothetical protein